MSFCPSKTGVEIWLLIDKMTDRNFRFIPMASCNHALESDWINRCSHKLETTNTSLQTLDKNLTSFSLRCYDLLDACKFQDFWTLWKELEGSYSDLKTLIQPDQSLRQGILDVLARCYRAAPMSVVLTALNLESLDPSSYPTQIESLTETEAVFVATADNTKRTRVFQEGLKFSAISTFVAASQ